MNKFLAWAGLFLYHVVDSSTTSKALEKVIDASGALSKVSGKSGVWELERKVLLLFLDWVESDLGSPERRN